MGFLQKVDAFRTIPRDFCEGGTVHGALLTTAAAVLCVVLFACELGAFLTVTTRTRIVMDTNQDKLLQINFDVTMHDMPCEHLSVGVWDSFGSDRLNITGNIIRNAVNHDGSDGRAYTDDELLELEANELALSSVEREEYDSDWASTSDNFKHDNFDGVIEAHELTVILFYADWCPPCRAFKPKYEEFEDMVNGKKGARPVIKDADGFDITSGVRVLKINCVDFKNACADENIRSFPTARVYKRSVSRNRQYTEYQGDKPLLLVKPQEMLEFVQKEAAKKHFHTGAHHHNVFKEGCRVRGFVEVARVPGTLHMEARSTANKMLNSAFTNVSHVVHHFSFGSGSGDAAADQAKIPEEYVQNIAPLDGRNFYVDQFHMAPHHYIKVVSTTFESWGGLRTYQMTHQQRNANIPRRSVPQAKFSYDLAPVEVVVTQERKKKWYDFFTGTLAIVGGTYTVMGLASGALNTASKAFKSRIGKLD